MLTKAALNRRLKRKFLKANHSYFAVSSVGFERELLEEVRTLSASFNVEETRGGVEYAGPLDLVYEANLTLNVANRVLVRIKHFPAHSFPMLFDQVGRIPWEFWIADGKAYNIRVSTNHSKLNMKKRLVETCRSAIDSTLASAGVNSNYNSLAELQFVLRLSYDHATISFNTSGQHLHKRGYKRLTVAAPIRETLAAGILKRLEHENYDLIVDPFCGSGTFILEAARMSSRILPGSFRRFSYMDAPFYSPARSNAVIREVSKGLVPNMEKKFIGFDVSPEAVKAAKLNASAAGLDKPVSFDCADFKHVDYTTLGLGYRRKLLVSNPPYGKRVTSKGWSEHFFDELLPKLRGWTIALVRSEVQGNQFSTVGSYGSQFQTEITSFSNGGIPSQLIVLRT